MGLERGLGRWAGRWGGEPWQAGAGAAGGKSYGIAAGWRARLVTGSVEVARAAGLHEALAGADLVISGEGSFDEQSLGGKVVGYVIERAHHHGVRAAVAAGRVAPGAVPAGDATVSLTALAGSARAAVEDPRRWLHRAGATLAGLPATR